MHDSSLDLMKELRARHIKAGSSVLDVGGADVNGSYRGLFKDCSYKSLDYKAADIIVDSRDWPLQDSSFDAVISGQTLEHDAEFWTTIKEMVRVLRPGGILILIVPSAGAVHRHPVDCWRFLPDSMTALASWAGLQLRETAWRQASPWRDLAGVFKKPV